MLLCYQTPHRHQSCARGPQAGWAPLCHQEDPHECTAARQLFTHLARGGHPQPAAASQHRPLLSGEQDVVCAMGLSSSDLAVAVFPSGCRNKIKGCLLGMGWHAAVCCYMPHMTLFPCTCGRAEGRHGQRRPISGRCQTAKMMNGAAAAL